MVIAPVVVLAVVGLTAVIFLKRNVNVSDLLYNSYSTSMTTIIVIILILINSYYPP